MIAYRRSIVILSKFSRGYTLCVPTVYVDVRRQMANIFSSRRRHRRKLYRDFIMYAVVIDGD